MGAKRKPIHELVSDKHLQHLYIGVGVQNFEPLTHAIIAQGITEGPNFGYDCGRCHAGLFFLFSN